MTNSSTFLLALGKKEDNRNSFFSSQTLRVFWSVFNVVLVCLVILGSLLLIPSPRKIYANLGDQCGSLIGIAAGQRLCCSNEGHTGFTDDHCLEESCQKDYGVCDESQMELPIISECLDSNEFALTFDDGPSIFTESLLDYLLSKNIKATFFLNGANWKLDYIYFPDPANKLAEKVPQTNIYDNLPIVKRMIKDNHQICHHTWSHTSISKISQTNLTFEITRLNQVFAETIGKIPTCIRAPYGDISSQGSRLLRRMGFEAFVHWKVDPRDWDPEFFGIDPKTQINGMMNKTFSTRPKSTISLNHDVVPTTADFKFLGKTGIKPLTQKMVEFLEGQGFKFVTIDKCIGKPVGSMYRPIYPYDYIVE